MSLKLLQQAIMLALCFGIIFLYIQPKLIDLREVQAEVSQYTNAITNATQFADLLQTQLNQVVAISRADDQAIETFLPRTLDHVAVLRDLQTIASQTGMQTLTLSYSEGDVDLPVRSIQADDTIAGDTSDFEESVDSQTLLTRTPFNIDVQGTYDQFIGFLRALEANVYPLIVTEISLSDSSLPEELQMNDPIMVYMLSIEVVSVEPNVAR
jgi:Tfp pilus assembly protein PilO